MIQSISHVLYLVATSTLVPVILALLGLAVWSLLLVGGIVREWFVRRSAKGALNAVTAALHQADAKDAEDAVRSVLQSRLGQPAGYVPRYLLTCWQETGMQSGCRAASCVDEIELEMLASTSRLSAIARVGPMLGLVGTLIPLGPGLVSLAQGDVAGLASRLVIAFSTTIVGVLIGVVAFVCAHVRRGWYARDLASILSLEEVRQQCEDQPR